MINFLYFDFFNNVQHINIILLLLSKIKYILYYIKIIKNNALNINSIFPNLY